MTEYYNFELIDLNTLEIITNYRIYNYQDAYAFALLRKNEIGRFSYGFDYGDYSTTKGVTICNKYGYRINRQICKIHYDDQINYCGKHIRPLLCIIAGKFQRISKQKQELLTM